MFDGPARAVRAALAPATPCVRSASRSVPACTPARWSSWETSRQASPSTPAPAWPAAAEPGEVLVSSTVKDLVAGSGLEFEERGEHELKGVPGTWRLYAVVDA